MELLKFIFGSFWTFAGVVMLIIAIASCINSHIAAIQDARIKGKRVIRIISRPKEDLIWIVHPTDEDVEKLLTDKSLEVKLGRKPWESGPVGEKEDWEF